MCLDPFLVDLLVISGAVGSPVVYTTPAPPLVVPAEALPSVYIVMVGFSDLICLTAASMIVASGAFLLRCLEEYR